MAAHHGAEVRLHGRRVGTLRHDRGRSSFTYEDDPSAPGHMVLGQIFEDDPALVRTARVGLPPWFANLLPEGALRRQIVREMGGGNIGDYTLLLRLGHYLPGAVTVHAEDEPDGDTHTVTSAEVADQPLRQSLAGFQLKFSIASDKVTVPVSGPGEWWIAKLPDRAMRDLAVNEYLTMRWLAHAGFPVPPINLVPAADIPGLPDGAVDPASELFLVERFDRHRDGSIHVEDFAQVADVAPMFKYSESGATYESIGSVVSALLGEEGFRDYVRRLVAMLVTGNTDAHLKNWALIYPDGRAPRLAPVYDFHSLTIYSRYRFQPLALSINGERVPGRIYSAHIERLADGCGFDAQWTAEVVAATVRELREAWQGSMRDEAHARFAALADHFAQRLSSLPICAAA